MKDISSRIDKDKGVIYLTERERTAQLIKPILRGRDIKRYSYEWAGLWIILAIFDSHKYLEKDYPAIYNHLLQYKDKLQARGQCRYARGNKADTGKGYSGQHHWLELDNNPKDSYINEFAKPKIVYSEIVREPQFYLDNGEFKFGHFYAEATSFILTGEHLEYLLGILHSKLATFAFKNFYAGGGLGESGYRYKKAFLEKLPIPKLSKSQESEFVAIVQKIIDMHKQLKVAQNAQDSHMNLTALNEKLNALQSQLDSMVYKLYGLDDTEIELIRGGVVYSLALLLIASIYSKLSALTQMLCENFESALKAAFYFCEGLSVPQIQNEGKIIYPNMAKEFIAYLDTQGFFTNQKCFILTDNKRDEERLLYLTAILNSKINFWYFKQIGATLGAGGYEMSKIFVEKLPIIKINKVDSMLLCEIKALASEILKAKAKNSTNNTNALESKLDSKIYELYNLSQDEIHLIESTFSNQERERERTEIINNFYHLWECYARDSYLLYAQSPCQTISQSSLQPHISFTNAYEGKIIYPCIMAKESCFAYEEKGFFAPAPANIITGNQSDMKYLTGLLNSSMIYFVMRQFYMGGGIEGELKTNNLLKLPIPKIDSTNENLASEIIALVDKILESKAKDSKADTTTIENQIDNLVYKLYNLSDNEIKIIKGKL